MRYIIQMSEQDIKDVLAKHFDTKPENVEIQHKNRYISSGAHTETVPYIEIEVMKQIQE